MNAPQPAATTLLLLAELPPAVAAAARRLRAMLAPEAAARMPAHCSLFRHLPGPSADRLAGDLRRLVRGFRPPVIRIGPPGARDRAIWLPVDAPELLAIRARLADDWAPMLLAAERGPPRLHITLAAGLEPAALRAALTRAADAEANLPFIGQTLDCRALVLVPHQPPGAAPLLRAGFRS